MASTATPTLLFLGLPSKTFIGLDLVSFNSSPKFHGITNVPPGFHFLYTGTDASLAIRHGRWLYINTRPTKPATHVYSWTSEDESLTLLDPEDETAQHAVRAVPELQKRGLVDYNALEDANIEARSKESTSSENDTTSQVDASDWPSLTTHISSSLLTRVLTSSWTISSISSGASDTEKIPGLSDFETSSALYDSTLNSLPINLKQTWPENAIGRDRTLKAQDRSWYLNHLIETISPASQSQDRQAAAREILGELQLCFLMVLTLANYSCLEQWKRVLTVVFTCKHAMLEVERYFIEAVDVLLLQLRHAEDVDGGVFELREEASSAWLRLLLARFRGSLDEVFPITAVGKSGSAAETAGQKLKDKFKELESFMQEKYGWEDLKNVLRRGTIELEDGERIEVSMDGLDEEEETGEYAPTVVET